MALLLKKLYLAYNILFDELSDPRTAEWPLMSSPFPIVSILAFYLYFVKSLGPRMMIYRNPLQLKGIMIVYNICQIFLCAYVFFRGLQLGWWSRYRWFCEPVDFSTSEHAMSVVRLVYVYFGIKVLDLIDTVFFVLRKKQGHVSFLHVYHHTGMVVLLWSCVKFLPGGHGTSLGVINAFVHVVMYSYYLLCLLDDKYRASIWWKKHITQMQIVQFFMIAIHFSGLFFVPDCKFPRWVGGVIVPQNVFMTSMFVDFYIKAYIKKNKGKNQNGVENGVEAKHTNGFNAHAAENGRKLE